MNFKKILLGSAVFASTFGLIACGGDSSSSADDPQPNSVPSQGDPVVLPEQSAINPIMFSSVGTSLSISALPKSSTVSISGIIQLNMEGITLDPSFSPEAVPKIDSVRFFVVDDKTINQSVTVPLDGVVFPTELIPLSGKTFETAELNGCGNFHLQIVVYSSTQEPNVKTVIYTSVFGDDPEEITSGSFVREQNQCEADLPPSSSSTEPAVCTEVTAHEITLSTSLGSDQHALNFETGLADNPHITISFEDGVAYATPAAGVTLFEDNYSQTNGLLPDKVPLCLEDFKASVRQFKDELANGTWVIVTTADGKQYPFMAGKTMTESGSKGSIKITYYK